MKRLLLLPIFMFSLSFAASAQDFGSAVGARLGSPLSASYKFFLSESSAIEGIASFRSFTGYSWFSVGAAYQLHKDIEKVDGLDWYYGGGASAYFYSYDLGILDEGSVGFGLQGYLGLSYTFDNVPINLSIDWIPTILIGGVSGFSGDSGALGVRYILGRSSK